MNLKKPLAKWQNQLNGKGWNTLYLENHDQPRSINRFGSLSYRYESATMLATMIYFQQGTPFIYQGQEIGSVNADFSDLDSYRDIETHNIYSLGRKLGFTHKRMMRKIRYMSRDNSRTPMQWNGSDNCGFTNGAPWLTFNPNAKTINVELDQKSEKSVFRFYQKIISLRKQYPLIVYGNYHDLDFHNPKIYSYRRFDKNEDLIVVCNFTNQDLSYNQTYPDYQVILTNYPDNSGGILRPFEARVYYKKK